MVNNRARGRRIELETRNLLRGLGLLAERRDQSENADEKPDLEVRVTNPGAMAAVEVKGRKQQCSLSFLIDTLQQTVEQNQHTEHHAVVARLDGRRPVVIITLEEWAQLFESTQHLRATQDHDMA